MYYLIPLLNLIGLELILIYPIFIYGVSLCITALTLFFLYRYTRDIDTSRFSIIISAILFFIVHYVMLLFLEGIWLMQVFIVLTNFILYVFLYSVHKRTKMGDSTNYQPNYALENIIGYFNLLIFFFLTIAVFYLDLNTNQKFIWILGIFLVSAFFLSYSSLAIFKIPHSERLFLYLGILLLSLVELFWVINFLPISVYSKAALVTFVYYTVVGLSRHYLIFGEKELTYRVLRRYLVITSIGALAVFLTSRW